MRRVDLRLGEHSAALRLPLLAMLAALLPCRIAQAETKDREANPFKKSYLMLEFARNYPVSFTQNDFLPGPYLPVFGYRHNLDQNWMMGVGGQIKMFNRRDDDEADSGVLAFWTLTHETLYMIRLDYPTYLLIGPKLHYLLPTDSGSLPIQRSEEFETEVGVALSMGIAHLVGDRFMLTARMDRWRGTKTMKFHGLEVAAGLGYAL